MAYFILKYILCKVLIFIQKYISFQIVFDTAKIENVNCHFTLLTSKPQNSKISIKKYWIKFGNIKPAKDTPTAAIPRALPACFSNQEETNFEVARFPIKVAPRAIGNP